MKPTDRCQVSSDRQHAHPEPNLFFRGRATSVSSELSFRPTYPWGTRVGERVVVCAGPCSARTHFGAFLTKCPGHPGYALHYTVGCNVRMCRFHAEPCQTACSTALGEVEPNGGSAAPFMLCPWRREAEAGRVGTRRAEARRGTGERRRGVGSSHDGRRRRRCGAPTGKGGASEALALA
jgi:hypothetical protein